MAHRGKRRHLIMMQLTARDVHAHQAEVPWPSLLQVEQDLLLCRAMAALFADKFLHGQLAMRGGTLLHKVHLAPAARYSEDIDIVVVGDRPEGHIRRALRRVLTPVLGKPQRSAWEWARLAVRNAVRPSKVLRMTYAVPSVVEPGQELRIVVEANVTERKPHRPIANMRFTFPFRSEKIETAIRGYEINEMLGTKMRALFQRRRGRDLFDLYRAMTMTGVGFEASAVIESFCHYLKQEETRANRSEFTALLDAYLEDPGFLSDMDDLLRQGIKYSPIEAGRAIQKTLLAFLPD
jgi:predicted nucleotidyltransferase component of viral defense system